MKKLKLSETNYIELTDEEFNRQKTIKIIDENTNEFICEAKRLSLHNKIIIIAPIANFESEV